jgi:hypothetical protein
MRCILEVKKDALKFPDEARRVRRGQSERSPLRIRRRERIKQFYGFSVITHHPCLPWRICLSVCGISNTLAFLRQTKSRRLGMRRTKIAGLAFAHIISGRVSAYLL